MPVGNGTEYMKVIPDQYLIRIHELWPDLMIQKMDYNTDGMVNDVLIINDELVFRFCKTKQVEPELQHEIKMWKFLRPYLSVRLPMPQEEFQDLVVYPYILGEPLTRDMLSTLDAPTQNNLAAELGIFLHQLHSIPTISAGWELRRSPAPTRREDWIRLQDRIKEKVYPFLLPFQINWCQAIFHQALNDQSFFLYEPVIIHGDLACYHLLVDEAGHHLVAVLDFGTSGVSDPASDVGSLITYYGESFISKIQSQYPRYDSIIQRARFYAQAIELQWLLLGFETGEQFWFTSHIGNARGIFS